MSQEEQKEETLTELNGELGEISVALNTRRWQFAQSFANKQTDVVKKQLALVIVQLLKDNDGLIEKYEDLKELRNKIRLYCSEAACLIDLHANNLRNIAIGNAPTNSSE